MHLRLVAVGDRQPDWVDAACADYAGRLPPAFRFRQTLLAASRQRKSGNAARAKADESARILGELKADERVVMLDERGRQFSSAGLAAALAEWQRDGRDVCFVIGGADGLDADCRARADLTWSLSKLTLPHGLARVLCLEQLYRATTINDGHPYHRA